MKNLKRVLSLALSGIMLVGMMAVGASAVDAKDFTDAGDIQHTEAVNTLVALNVINGKDDGSYDPNGSLTRAEMAKLIVYALNGGKEPVMSTKAIPTYTDIKGNWAEKYIEYCSNLGIVAGVGGGAFNPSGILTGSQAAKMMLVAMNYKAEVFNFTGADWELNVNAEANKAGLYEDLAGMDPSATITRDNAAQLVYNGILAGTMKLTWGQNMSTGEITQSYQLDNAQSLFVTKFNGAIQKGYITGYTYDDVKGQWNYTLTPNGTAFGGPSFNTTTEGGVTVSNLKVNVDYTHLFGQQIKVIYKAGVTDSVYGFYVNDSAVLEEGVAGDIGTIDDTAGTVKINGTAYKFDNGDDKDTTLVWNQNGARATNSIAGLKAVKTPLRFRVVDNNMDGRIDCVVVTPLSIVKINYVGSDNITTALGNVKVEDIEIYEGYAKNDYVAVVDSANSAKCVDTYEKLELDTGKIDAIRGNATDGFEYRVDGTWYSNGTPTNTTVIAPSLNDEVEFVAMGGYFFYNKVMEKGNISKDLCMVITTDLDNTLDNINASNVKAKLLLADGTTRTVTVAKIDTADAALTKTGSTLTGNCADLAGKLFTYYVNNDGNYELTTVAAGETDESKLAGYDSATAAGQFAGGKIGTRSLSDDAIVFVLTNGTVGTSANTNKGKVFTGKEMKNAYPESGDSFGGSTASYGLVGVENGFNYIQVAIIGAGSDPLVNKGSNYGYLVSGAYETYESDKTWYNVKFWDGSADQEVKWEKQSGDTLGQYAAGALITYDAKETGIIKNVSVINATTGVVTGWDGTSKIEFNGASEQKITNETVLMFIDSANKKGAEGDISSISLADDTAAPWNKITAADQANVRYYDVTANRVGLLVVDIRNNMKAGPAMVLAGTATAADITAALSSANSVTLNGNATVAARALADGKTLVIAGNATLSGAVTGAKAKLVVNSFADAATSAANAQTGTVEIKNAATAATVKAVPTAAGKVLILGANTSDNVATADGFFATNGTAVDGNVLPQGTYTYYAEDSIKKADGSTITHGAGWYTAAAVNAVITAAG